jgi:acyl transferase domain-containing protein
MEITMGKDLTKEQIFEMIAQHKITANEGFQLLKTMQNPIYIHSSLELTETGARGEKNHLSRETGTTLSSSLLERAQQDLIRIAAPIANITEEEFDPDEDLQEYGFDSLTLTQLADKINQIYKTTIIPTLFFELSPPTLGSLVLCLFSQYRDCLSHYYRSDTHGGNIEIIKAGESQQKNQPVQNQPLQTLRPREPIAIIGMSCVLPQSENPEVFWSHLEEGNDLIDEVPIDRWNWRDLNEEIQSARWGGFIKDVDTFDADFFGISPREASLMDPQQRIFLETTWKTFEDAGYNIDDYSGKKIGLFAGVAGSDYLDILISRSVSLDAHALSGLSHAILANRISYLFNFHGPNEAIDTACSSSLVAVNRALESIRSGTCEMAVAGGVNLILSPRWVTAFHNSGMLSRDGRCKTFAMGADGYVRSEGAGAILLKPLSRAEADGDHIYAVIIGASENHGGHAQSLTAPNANSQAALLIDAYQNATIDPTTVTYIETHGTGTELGDPIEINGLKKAFNELHKQNRKPIPAKPYCGIGSVKTNIGHLETAAGIAGVIKVLLAMKHKKLPATVHFKQQNPYIDLKDSPFYIVTETGKWDCLTDDKNRMIPRRAGISSFGFGGTNVHLVLEEYFPPQPPQAPIAPRGIEPQLFVLSAKTEERLKAYTEEMLRYLEKNHPLKATDRQPQPPRENPERIRQQLVKITAEILNVNEKDINLDEDLKDCGFDQISLAALVNQINDRYNTTINVSIFYQYSSLNEVAGYLCGEEPAGQEKQVPLSMEPPELSLERIAYTLQVGRKNLEKRLAVVVDGIDELVEKLTVYSRGRSNDTGVNGVYVSSIDTATAHRGTETHGTGEPTGSKQIKEAMEKRDLEKIAQLFADGLDIDWSQLYPHRKLQRISLPNYPFAKTKYWAERIPKPGNHEEFIMKNNNMSVSTGSAISTGAHQQKIRLKNIPGNEKPGEEILSGRTGRTKILLKKSSPSLHKVKKEEKVENREKVKAIVQEQVKTIQVKTILANVLFMEPSKVDENKVFTELGLDSILAVEFSRKLNETFQVEIKATKLYDHATVTKLTQYLNSQGSQYTEYTGEATPVSTNELPEETESLLGARIKEILANILFMDPVKVHENKAFMEMGLDSILAVEFSKKLNETFPIEIKATTLYEYSTINKLKHFIISRGVKITNDKTAPVNHEKAATTVYKKGETEIPETPDESIIQPGLAAKSKDIAIIGMSARYPGADNSSQYWQNLENGVDSVTEVPPDRWDVETYYDPDGNKPGKTAAKWGGFLQDIDKFDPLFFNISPAEAELLDPQQRLFLQEAWRAIEDAGYAPESLNNVKCGVYVGAMSGIEYLSDSMLNAHAILASRISYLLNLKGPALSIDTACSSSLVAIHLACRSLLEGETEMMLAGGVSLYLTEKPYIGMTRMGDILSRTGKCKAFDNSADGFVPGEGVGVLVLKLLEKAEADGDHIYGVIKGSGINQDGRTNGITAPSAESQKELELEVYNKYGINPETISYVETHGTGTKLGDPIELDALTAAFSRYTRKKQYCPIGSVKTNLGHTSAAAGAAGAIKVLLSMEHKKIPPSLHFHQENEHIDFKETPFYVNTRLRQWTPPGDIPRRAAISSFGYSGTNAHMVIEEPPAPKKTYSKPGKTNHFYLLPVSAKTEDALKNKFADLLHWLNREGNRRKYSTGDIAYTLGVGRSHFPVRAAMVVKDNEEITHTLERIAGGEKPENYFVNKINNADPPDENKLKKVVEPLLEELHTDAGLSEIESKDKLIKLAELYINGYDPKPGYFYPENGCKRISLPAYPFAKQRYWKPQPGSAAQAPDSPQESKYPEIQSIPRPSKRIDNENEIETHIKKDLVKWVERILKVKEEDIDTDGSLLEYGFDSITFTEYIKQINREYGITLAIESVFDLKRPTIASLSRYLDREFNEPLTRYFRQEEAGVINDPGMTISANDSAANDITSAAPRDQLTEPAEPIAVIGISGIMPQADTPEHFRENLEKGKRPQETIPEQRWKTAAFPAETFKETFKRKKGGFIKPVESFDAEFFGISPEEAVLMDPQQRLFLQESWKAIEDAGYKPSDLSEKTTGVFVGVSPSGYDELILKTIDHGKDGSRRARVLNAPPVVAHRTSYHLNLRGPSETLDAAESGSLAALHRAVASLQEKRCTLAIVGGVHLFLDPIKLQTWDNQENHYTPGEGVGAAVLKPLNQAIANGDHIYAVIDNTSATHTGNSLPFFAGPDSISPESVKRAIKKMQISLETLDYLEILGPAPDNNGKEPVEIAALKAAFSTDPGKIRCGIGSITSDIGNLEAAAGIAALFKILLALKYKKIPATHYGKLSPTPWNLKGTPFYLQEETRSWECLIDKKNQIIPRRAGIIHFSSSGSVSHVEIQEYTHPAAQPVVLPEETPQIIVLSAKNKERLKVYAGQMKEFLENTPDHRQSPPPIDKKNLRQQIEGDVLPIANETLKADAQGYESSSIRAFIREVNQTFKLTITVDLFKTQPSVGAFVKYLGKTYKKELEEYYNNPHPSPAPRLEEIAYTLQVGREAMAERLAIIATGTAELKEKLNAYSQGKKKIKNVFTGNVNGLQGQATLLMEGEEKDVFLESLIRNRKLDKLARCWVLGVEIHWQALYPNQTPRRISLSPYPFENKRYWPDSPRKQIKSRKDIIKEK